MTDREDERRRFIANPLDYDGDAPPPTQWLAEGWSIEAFRDHVVYILARSAAKVGSFALAGDWLVWLSSALTPEQARRLYVRIRDESERFEVEWRPHFEAAFPGCPLPASHDDEIVMATLREMITSGAGQGFEHLVTTLLELPVASEALDPASPRSLLVLAQHHRRGVMLAILEDARKAYASSRGEGA